MEESNYGVPFTIERLLIRLYAQREEDAQKLLKQCLHIAYMTGKIDGATEIHDSIREGIESYDKGDADVRQNPGPAKG